MLNTPKLLIQFSKKTFKLTYKTIAQKLNLTPKTISRILQNKTSHLSFHNFLLFLNSLTPDQKYKLYQFMTNDLLTHTDYNDYTINQNLINKHLMDLNKTNKNTQ